MIDVIFADHQELFHVGVAEMVADADDICLMAQPRSAEQLLNILATFIPQVLVLSTNFLPAFSKIQPMLKRRQTALLLLAVKGGAKLDHCGGVKVDQLNM